ncbi:hypothetical protein A33Q_2322 [Indibacter alkaliphilus LW1]|uniref:DUF4382 domain-containing protein n=1 Tax=Indibacter alkaliphilus (strain CCUG 57479 / KCTC 22604 / LW1) TaxID=1189612 RepID=S2DBL9_INDAL|nr:DUF4382 domain-containing protein [Indibacter alkaliphilus]EOZ96552.1 hypothetical protein A33Q_2322 [Indibacter alkaliphilus LW1]
MKNKLLSMMLSMLAALGMISCDQQENYNTITEGNAKVNVLLVDAPADYEEVWVEVLAVRILPHGNNESEDSGWVHLDHESEERMVNLLSLVGNNEAYLGSVEVPAGRVSQIRLLLGDNNYIIKNGERIDLKTPSAQQSGLKLQVNKEFESGREYDLIIDFDAGRSIVRAGNSGNYILKPVLRVVAETAASIQGTILPVEAQPKVTATRNGESFSTFTDENGFFRLRGIPGGTYVIEIEPLEPYLPVILDGVSVGNGETVTIETITLNTED